MVPALEDKKIFVVVGPEASGTRVVTRLLIESGCWGSHEHLQPLDCVLDGSVKDIREIAKDAQNFVLRRSVPHGTNWPDLLRLQVLLKSLGFDPFFIVVVRDWFATLKACERSMTEMVERWNFIMRFLPSITNFCFFLTSYYFLRPKDAIKSLSYMLKFELNKNVIPKILPVDDKYHRKC